MAAQMIKISGKITVPHLGTAGFQLPFGVTVELSAIAAGTTAGAWIGSSPVDPEVHTFETMTTYPLKTNEQINYAVYKGSIPIQQGQVTATNAQANIALTETSYQKLSTPEQETYATISGKVSLGDRNITAVPLTQEIATVLVRKAEFSTQSPPSPPPPVAQTFIDQFGNYSVKVPISALRQEGWSDNCCEEGRLTRIEVLIQASSEIIARSGFVALVDTCSNIDLHISNTGYYQTFFTEYENVARDITRISNKQPAAFKDITTTGPASGLELITGASSLPADKIMAMIYGSINAASLSIAQEHSYAITLAKGLNTADWMDMSLTEVTTIITAAQNDRIVAVVSGINTTYTNIHNMTVQASSNFKTEDGYTLTQLIDSFSTKAGASARLIELSLQMKEGTAADLWSVIKTEYGETTMNDLQVGMQALAISGMQPEITKEITVNKESMPLSKIATDWTATQWRTLVDKVCRDNNKLCVPANIRGNATDPNDDAVKTAYANRLSELTSDVFATTILGDRIGKGQLDAALIKNPVATADFIKRNPLFDLRSNSIWDAGSLAGYSTNVREDLIPVQNMLRATGNNPGAAIALLNNKIKSSADIVELSQDAFVAKFAGNFSSTAAAQQVYQQAIQTNLNIAGLKTTIQPNNYITSVLPAVDWVKFLQHPDPATAPNLQTLFGSLDFCSCSECMSMYSPAAYYTDLMNFIKNKLGANSKAYTELTRRRTDLPFIDLTCKNTNTPVPYIDLVNELLELIILRSIGVTPPFSSYQTSGSEQDLAAYPEHTYRDTTTGKLEPYTGYEAVYNTTLRGAIYPSNLPFDLPLEESRTYLQHLGYTRQELMQQFRPTNYTQSTATTTINEYNALTEWLKLSKTEADIITEQYAISPTGENEAIFYGFSNVQTPDWRTVLCNGNTSEPGLKALLKRCQVTFKELTQLLSTKFLNSKSDTEKRIFTIESADNTSCQLEKLYLKYNQTSGLDVTQARLRLFKRLYRFIRLQRATGWSSYQLDLVLSSLGDPLTLPLNQADYIRIVKTHQLSQRLNTAPEKLCSFWSKISTDSYININSEQQVDLPSLYDRLFNNKSVLNTVNIAFAAPDNIQGSYRQQAGTIVAAFNIKEEELFQVLGYLGLSPDATAPAPQITRTALGRIYGLAQIAAGMRIAVNDLLRLLSLMGISGPGLLNPATDVYTLLEPIVNNIAVIKGFIFNQDEVDYLVACKDQQLIYTPADASIQLFYETLRSELKKLTGDTVVQTTDLQKALRNLTIQYFSAYFNVDGATAQYLGSSAIKINNGTLPLFDALVLPAFINALEAPGTDPNKPLPITRANAIPAFAFAEIFNAFEQATKSVMLLKRFKITAEEFTFFFEQATQLDIIQIGKLPIVAGPNTATLWQQLQQLDNWIKVKGKLNLRATELLEIMNLSLGTLTKGAWITAVAKYTEWAKTELEFLLGTGNAASGILNTTYSATGSNNDFRKGALLLQLADIMQSAQRIGLSPSASYPALRSDLTMDTSRVIRKAAKAKHTDQEWLKIAKPLQDTLREKQRKAMVAYVIAKGGTIITGNNVKWDNENDLFAYLLIDVEMQPCMKTSRIKQGVSSLQLYMDRVVLNLENYNGVPTDHITITPPMTEQWRAWRKWYRIWEANRKIFLYPENWIEPELRDDKTPFFKELETELLQDEVKDNTVETAYRAYLEKLEEVGKLEPITTYQQVEKDSTGKVSLDRTHVFARTTSLPRRYFYRYLDNNEWSPWQRMNVDIKSDHMVPVIWNRKLYIFWLTFTKKKPDETDSGNIRGRLRFNNIPEWVEVLTASRSNRPGDVYVNDPKYYGYSNLEITLNWSQYKEGKWLATEMCNDLMTISIPEAVINNTDLALYNDQARSRKMIDGLTNRGTITLDDFFRNRLYLHQTFDTPDVESSGIDFSILFAPGLSEIATGIHGFFWRGDNSNDPVVIRNTEKGFQIMAPSGTQFNKMKFQEDPQQDGKLRKDNTTFAPGFTTDNRYYSFSSGNIETKPGLVRGSNSIILNNTPNGAFKVTARAGTMGDPDYHFHNPMLNDFFFEDVKNTFFARWQPYTNYTTSVNTVVNPNQISLGSAANFVQSYYPTPGNITIGTPQYQIGTNPVLQVANSAGYRFHTFYHTSVHDLVKALNKEGIPGLLKIENQSKSDNMTFAGNYQPTSLVHPTHPGNAMQFDFSESYSMYNWELFFHAPMLIAQRLMDNQQFEEAQKWYHYIFNPTSNTDKTGISYTGAIKRFWKFYPFYKESEQPVETLNDLLLAINNGNAQAELQVAKWEQNPFKPHVIARMRILAYMKNVLMKYLDNLIAWGDQLFRRDTIESINEATQLYILAANLLGTRPQEIPARSGSGIYNFDQLSNNGLDALSNSMVNIEAFFGPNSGTPVGTSTGTPFYGKMFYFCLPKNDKLMAYWDTVADRLFKIRNCMNLEGTTRQLPLFEPPIDPALLVRATAMGVDINSILDTAATVKLPHYRFSYMLQKANEFCGEVRGLGNTLLSTLEKKDAEQLALLRSGQELNLLGKMKLIKEAQISEAEANLEALRRTKENTEMWNKYYSSRTFTNASEQKHLQSIQDGLVLQAIQGGLQTTGSTLSIFPQFHIQGLATGTSIGGEQAYRALNAISSAVGIAATINNAKGSMAVTLGGYQRRQDDWTFQADTAAKELEQMDQQILAAEIRLDIARKDLTNHELQMDNAAETDSFMRSKFTNTELYTWTLNQVAATYFQSYQLAYDLARKAEECYKAELPAGQRPVGNFIKFGYWDSLRKGLMSGEKLQFDLRKMEATYMEENERELELTKHFSLAMIGPFSLLVLREQGSCTFGLDETWFDLDYPGHYMRRIKSVSISIPCIAGPYTSIASRLTLLENALQKDPDSTSYEIMPVSVSAMATSTGQNDAGMFELNFRDERYIPFENAGAISYWQLDLMDDKSLRQFDYDTITDVIIHVRYTARDDKRTTGNKAIATKTKLRDQLSEAGTSLPRYFSLKHEFSNEWYAGFNKLSPPLSGTTPVGHKLDLYLQPSQFPQYAQHKQIKVTHARFFFKKPETDGTVYKVICNGTTVSATNAGPFVLAAVNLGTSMTIEQARQALPVTFYKEENSAITELTEPELDDVYLVLQYQLQATA